jgi:putative ABC transport system permease protein
VQFRAVQREDVTLVFHEPLASEVRHAVAGLPATLQAEPYRIDPARLRRGAVTRRVAIYGLPEGAELRRILGADLAEVEPPREGVVLTERLAEILSIRPGESLTVEVLEGERPRRKVTVVGTVDELFGLNAYMEASSLHRLMREQGSWSGAYLRVDDAAAPLLHAELKRMPAVAGASSRLAMLKSFDETLARSLGIFTGVLIFFASIIACSVVYNSARIALSERGRELASLRVLGFTRGEISAILLGEQAILTAVAVPIGFWIGRVLCTQIAGAYQWESFRMPVVLSLRTHVFATLVIALAAMASGLVVRRRLDQLDLVAVLKTRE